MDYIIENRIKTRVQNQQSNKVKTVSMYLFGLLKFLAVYVSIVNHKYFQVFFPYAILSNAEIKLNHTNFITKLITKSKHLYKYSKYWPKDC